MLYKYGLVYPCCGRIVDRMTEIIETHEEIILDANIFLEENFTRSVNARSSFTCPYCGTINVPGAVFNERELLVKYLEFMNFEVIVDCSMAFRRRLVKVGDFVTV